MVRCSGVHGRGDLPGNASNKQQNFKIQFLQINQAKLCTNHQEFMGEETSLEKLFKSMDKDGDGTVTKEVQAIIFIFIVAIIFIFIVVIIIIFIVIIMIIFIIVIIIFLSPMIITSRTISQEFRKICKNLTQDQVANVAKLKYGKKEKIIKKDQTIDFLLFHIKGVRCVCKI